VDDANMNLPSLREQSIQLTKRPKYPKKWRKSRPKRWWNRPGAKWAGTAIVAPVLVGVLVWLIQRPFAPSASPTTTASPRVSASASKQPEGPSVVVDLVLLERPSSAPTWIFPNAIRLSDGELGRLNSMSHYSDEQDPWFRRKGAVDPIDTNIKIVAHGNRDRPVRIVDMKVVPRCSAPLMGTLFESPTAGSEESVRLGFDLDEEDPRARTIVNKSQWEGDYFQRKTISLKRDEEITFQVLARTLKHYCEFSLVLEILDRGTLVRQAIDDHGKPFKVSALRTSSDKYGSPVTDYAAYQEVYVGGLMNVENDGKWRREAFKARPPA
jgi:hypothetical protein